MSAKRPFVPVRTARGTVYRIQTAPRRTPDAESAALMVAIGRNIEGWRQRRELTQDELAAMVGCDRSAVCRWETGNRLPSLRHLMTLGRALGCDARALLPEECE
jgi:DNA-binding XRE family transcriptional regulator